MVQQEDKDTGVAAMGNVMTFEDYYHNTVQFSFADHPFSQHPKHVWVICRFCNHWLLTEHPRRGWEFPGGKVEIGESAESAAKREVLEETGANVAELIYIGQYKVAGKSGTIIKNVYFADIDHIRSKDHYYETNGPIFLQCVPREVRDLKKYSFMMKDDVLVKSLDYIEKRLLQKSGPAFSE